MPVNDDRPLLDLNPTMLEDARVVVALALWCGTSQLARTSTLEDAIGLACLGDAADELGAPGEPGVRWPSSQLRGPIQEAGRRVIEAAAQHTADDAERAEWWDEQSARAERVLSALARPRAN